ncbi:2-phosphoglycerate kinase [Wukongibacter sp. M2B1]|uniref:2-phosphoglycerate kinase n=1 Tax=Wukongibacter sp. M2B1 TaxID=3088895 RepID=UPI003D7A1083
MVILLGGNSCTGKTLMSQKLLEKYKIPYFSVDHLKMGLYRSNRNCGFTPLDSKEVIANKLWPIIREMIKTIIENNQNIIIEGCYLLPELVKDLEAKYPNQIVSVFLVFSTNYIEENFASNIIKYRNVIETRKYNEIRPITQFIYEHNELRKECIQYGVEYFEIDNNYEEEIEKIFDFIENKIGELNQKR